MNTAINYESEARPTIRVDIGELRNPKHWDPHKTSDGRKKATAADPIRDPEQVRAVAEWLLTHGKSRRYGLRNKMAFILGVTTGLRSSDIRNLKIGDVLREDGTFYKHITIREQKTKKTNDPKLGSAAVAAITEYLNCLDSFTLNDYLIASERGGKLDASQLYRILQSAKEGLGLEGNIGTHTMRKTYGYRVIHDHPEDVGALTHLQQMLNHSSSQTTLRYCGISQDEEEKYYDSVNELFG